MVCFVFYPFKLQRVNMAHQTSILEAALAIERGAHQRSSMVTYSLLYKKALVP
jgi:hypothetical protein